MEYTDYITDEPISREQYIANGLERGELLYRYDCGCVIIQDRTADAYIVYCHKHAAALELYEALMMAREELCFGGDWETARTKIDKALAKAEGK